MLLKISVAFAVLLGLLLLNQYKVQKEEKKIEDEDKGKKLLSFDMGSIRKISIQSPKGKVVLEKRQKNEGNEHTDEFAYLDQETLLVSEWLVVEPYRELADRTMIQALQTNLESVESSKVIREDGQNASDYKLTQPVILVELFQENQGQPVDSLKIGAENTAGTGFYAQTSKTPRIVLIDKAIDFNTNKDPKDWRTKGILNFKDTKAIKKIQVSYATPSSNYEFVRADDLGWKMEKPKQLPANDMVVDGILRHINGLQLKAIASENKAADAAKYGLTKPSIKIVTQEAEGQRSKTFLVGKVDASKGSAYVARADTNRIYEVVPTLKDDLTKTLDTFIGKKAFLMKVEDMDAVEIVQKEKTVDLVKKNENWILVKDKDATEAKSFTGIFKLQTLEASEFIGAAYAKLPKVFDMTITVKAKDLSETLDLFKDKTKDGFYIGKQNKTGLFFRFMEKDIEAIQNAVKALLGENVEEAHASEEEHGSNDGHDHGH